MKIAKKVLAVVMAVAMIAALSAMAFAADNTKLVLKTGEVDKDGYLPVTIAVANGVGTKTVDVTLKYDAAVLTYSENTEDDTDAAMLKNCKSDSNKSNIAAVNGEKAGEIQYAYAFATTMLSAAEYAADAARGKTVTVNDKEFTFVTLYFKVADDKAANTKIEYTAKLDETTDTGSATAVLKEEVVTEAPAVVETTEKVTNPPTGDGDKKTGDNMALAAAAGVVVLAGAAFIISKKRK